jgi:hypothetical protein
MRGHLQSRVCACGGDIERESHVRREPLRRTDAIVSLATHS